MQELIVTTVMAGFLAILMVPLSLQISIKRVNMGGVVFGDANDDNLRRKIRAHGNFIEYAPMGLIVLALLEYNIGANIYIWALGVLLVLSRVLHAFGMLYGSTPTPRALAMLISHFFFITTGVWLILTLIF